MTTALTTEEFTRAYLDPFFRAYVECALLVNKRRSDAIRRGAVGRELRHFGHRAGTLLKMIDDCRRFQEANAADLALYDHPEWTAAELGGHDFWLTRNHHGAGFWDRDCLPEDAGQRLTDAAHEFGECDLYVGDDGMIYSN